MSITVTRQLTVQPLAWQVELADALLEQGLTTVAYVPDKKMNGILESLSATDVVLRSLTREEECIAYAAGQRLGGKRPVVMMQSSGLGNSINSLATWLLPSSLGVPLVISMRGTLGEANPSQVPMGRAVEPILASLGVQSFPVLPGSDIATLVEGVWTLAYQSGQCAALLLGGELGGGRATG